MRIDRITSSMAPRKTWALVLAVMAVVSMVASASASTTSRSAFDSGWKFARFGEMPDGSFLSEPKGQLRPEQAQFDDTEWRLLNHPSKQEFAEPFEGADEVMMDQVEANEQRVGWYRKSFDLPASAASRKIYVDFEIGRASCRERV